LQANVSVIHIDLPYNNIVMITVNPKFPTDTVAGLYKVAVASNHLFDAVRFDK